MLKAEIIAIGSELLTPEKIDTNSLWLTEKLNEIGIDVSAKCVIGDDEARLEEAFRDAIRSADVIISTGGLGPTEDDVTRQVAARAAGRALVFREDIVEELRERFARWGREMPEINKRQAYVIDGADVLENPNGSAPGMLLEFEGKFLVVLPGPPRELKPMFEAQVRLALAAKGDGQIARRRLLRVSGMGESALDEQIAPIYTSYTNVQTTILFNRSEIEVHLSARAALPGEAEAVLDELARKICDKLGVAVFSVNGELMEEVTGGLLRKLGRTLAVAESCTGGLIAQRLTEIPGSSAFFIEGCVTYANEAKMRTLGVAEETLEQFGAVSAETAEAMARGVRARAGTDFGISVTGIAGPDGGSDEKPVGLVYVGYADSAETMSLRLMLPGDRHLIRWRSSQAALDLLRRKILKKHG
jgi:nicotinamide-nucleotide amidase